MPNYSRRHSYYVKRTMDWIESHERQTQKTEVNYTIHTPKGPKYIKYDIWGADCAARCSVGVDIYQVKTGRHQVSEGIKQLSADQDWPPSVGRYVVWWDRGEKLAVGPNVVAVQEGTCKKTRDYAKSYRKIG